MRFAHFAWALAALLLATAPGAEPPAAKAPEVLRFAFDLADTAGMRHTQREFAGKRAIVLLFVGTECPLSNQYAPQFRRLHLEYSPRGVAFYAVHSDPDVEIEDIRRHAASYSLNFPVLHDPAQVLARQAGASITPQAVVVNPRGQLLYRGRIDDRAFVLGKQRPQPTRQDLQAALDQILTGRRVAIPETKAIGCLIPFPTEARAAAVTYSKHVAPILFRHCASCHRTGQVAPFSLLSYEDARRRAPLIATVTAARSMPPWKPVAGYGEFEDERRLSVAEIETLRRWAASGAPQSDAEATPAPPQFSSGWQLGTPDLVVSMPAPFRIRAEGGDVYQCFVIPMKLTEKRWVRAFEFRPGNRAVVHHALFFTDVSSAARRKDAAGPGDGYECFGTPGIIPTSAIGGWSPGNSAIRMPEGTAIPLDAQADLVMQLHYHLSGKEETDQSAIGFYFANAPPEKRLMEVALGSRRIDIAPGDARYRVIDYFTIPVDVWATGIIPHAHYLCKEMRGWAILPGGRKKWLLRIDDWDFDWQEVYRYRRPFLLPAGTRFEMEFLYDNSEHNPRNLSSPPRRVTWGGEMTDEMAGLHLQVIPARTSDAPELGRALWGKIMRSVGGGFYRAPEPGRKTPEQVPQD